MSAVMVWTAAYLLGSTPCGVLIARANNIDIQAHGSGNIGATNVARTLGKKQGILTLIGDCAKGGIAVLAAERLLDNPTEIAIAGICAVTGHLFSIFLKFKGGKGVATGLGVFSVLMPLAALASMAVFALAVTVSRYVSLGSILGALSLPLFGLLFEMPSPYIYASLAVGLAIAMKHHENIRRLWDGTEAKLLEK